MVKKERYHFDKGEVKSGIIEFVLGMDGKVSEPEIRKHLGDKFGVVAQGTINRHLHDLLEADCLEFFPPEKKGFRNSWDIKKLKNLENMLVQYPDLVEILQNSEHAMKIILDALEDALVSSTNLKRTKEYKEKYEEIKERLLNIRKDLTEKLKISTSFFKLCIRDEYSLYRNLSDLLEISENPTAEAYIGDNFKLFIKSPSCVDLAFKSCIALEIMERGGNVRKDMKKEIHFVKQMNNTVSDGQLNQLKKYYEKTNVAPIFIKDTKFINVENLKLYDLQYKFEKKGGKWDYLDDKEPEGPA